MNFFIQLRCAFPSVNISRKLLAAIIVLVFGISIVNAQGIVTTGLVAKYCFDANANDAIGIRHCAVNGAIPTTDRLGRINRAYAFDGVDDYIKLPNDVWISGDFTLTGWLFVQSYKNFARFFEFGNGTIADNIVYSPTPTGFSTGDAFIVRRNTCSPSPSEESAYAGPFPLGIWVHVAIVLRGSKGEVWRNAINTTLVSSPTIAPVCSVFRAQNYFGKSPWVTDEFFQGKMDDIRIYNRALSALEIDTLYKLDEACQPNGLVDYNNVAPENYLSQNAPNPVSASTIIDYKLPQNVQNATLSVYNVMGKQIKTFNLDPNKNGSVTIGKNEMLSGLYFYTLVVDEQTIGKRKMMVTAN